MLVVVTLEPIIHVLSICTSYFHGTQAFFGPRRPRSDHQPQAGRFGLTRAASAAQRRGDGGLGCGQPQDVLGAKDGGGERDVLARHRQARRPLVARDAAGIVESNPCRYFVYKMSFT